MGGDNNKSDDEKDQKRGGDTEKMEAVIKKMGRWHRKKYGTALENISVPLIQGRPTGHVGSEEAN
jgi:hypothetical protein